MTIAEATYEEKLKNSKTSKKKKPKNNKARIVVWNKPTLPNQGLVIYVKFYNPIT